MLLMLFKEIENSADYLSKSNTLTILLNGTSIEKIFYPNVVKDIINSTKRIRRIEYWTAIVFLFVLLKPTTDFLSYGQIEHRFLYLLVFSILPFAIFCILRTFRTEITNEEILAKSRDKNLAKSTLMYFSKLKESNYPIARNAASGLRSVGRLHKADGGLLTLLGNHLSLIHI